MARQDLPDCITEIQQLRQVLRNIIVASRLAVSMDTNHARVAADMAQLAQEGLEDE